MGHQVAILTERAKKVNDQREEYAQVEYFPPRKFNRLLLPISPVIKYNNFRKFLETNKSKFHYDLIIARDPLLAKAIMKEFPKVKLVYIPAVVIKFYSERVRKVTSIKDSIKELLRFSQLKVEQRMQRNVFETCSKIVVFSNNVKKQLIQVANVNESKIVICPPGFADKFNTTDNINNTLKQTINIKTLLFVGRLVKEKNIEMLIKALAKLKRLDVRLLLIGDGDERKALEKLSKELGIEYQVIFKGYKSNTEEYYKTSDYFVIPSTYEAFGQVIIESLACGTPVIGFASIPNKTLTAVEELIDNGITGFVCNSFSDDALSELLNSAINLSYTKEYQSMREKCTVKAQQEYSWNNLARRCLE